MNDKGWDNESEEDLNRLDIDNRMNSEDIEEELDREWRARQRKIRLVFKIVTVFVVLVFTSTMLGYWLRFLSWPSLDFLKESRILSRDVFIQELSESVVGIKGYKSEGLAASDYQGTGFNISSEGLIVTNRHLVDQAFVINVSFRGNQDFRAVNWYSSSEMDLAVIDIEGQGLPVVPLSEFPPEIGEEIVVIGNPLEMSRVAARGEIIDYYRIGESRSPVLLIDAPIYKGSSGSPVFNEDGEVVAIIFATARNEEDDDIIGLAVSVIYLHQLLNEHEVNF